MEALPDGASFTISPIIFLTRKASKKRSAWPRGGNDWHLSESEKNNKKQCNALLLGCAD